MNVLVAGFFGAIAGAGVFVFVAGALGRQVLPDLSRRARRTGLALREARPGPISLPVGAGVLAWLVTGWLGVGVLVACAFVVVGRLFGGERRRKEWIARSEAIAAWTEMLRDTMAAAEGIEGAIAATVPIAPAPIRDEVALLDARRRSEQPLPEALASFAAELDHPSGDLVVTALVSAAEGEGSDFARVLTRLAAIVRSEVTMRQEIEASRAQVHTSSRMMLAVLMLTALGFAVVSRGYFEPYASASGQVALVAIAALFTSGAVLLERLSRIETVERFVPRRRRAPTT